MIQGNEETLCATVKTETDGDNFIHIQNVIMLNDSEEIKREKLTDATDLSSSSVPRKKIKVDKVDDAFSDGNNKSFGSEEDLFQNEASDPLLDEYKVHSPEKVFIKVENAEQSNEHELACSTKEEQEHDPLPETGHNVLPIVRDEEESTDHLLPMKHSALEAADNGLKEKAKQEGTSKDADKRDFAGFGSNSDVKSEIAEATRILKSTIEFSKLSVDVPTSSVCYDEHEAIEENQGRTKRKSALNFMKRMKRFAAHGSYDEEKLGNKPEISDTPSTSFSSKRALSKTRTPVPCSSETGTLCYVCDESSNKPLTKRYGVLFCRSCYAFWMRVEGEPAVTSSFDTRFKCVQLKGTVGNCGVFIPEECYRSAYPIKGRCKACWIGRFLVRCGEMPFDKKQRIVNFLPKEMRLPILKMLPQEELDRRLAELVYKIWDINERPKPDKKKPLVILKHSSCWTKDLVSKYEEMHAQREQE